MKGTIYNPRPFNSKTRSPVRALYNAHCFHQMRRVPWGEFKRLLESGWFVWSTPDGPVRGTAAVCGARSVWLSK